ncbi:hypothetical protein F443_23143 [Phytophthora nicotianae P1569]|nr:hypothetical protein F443_23143 [Phytophthora nicotianae P1569]
MAAPDDLYERNDKSTKTQLLPEYRHLFVHSASSSFLRTCLSTSGSKSFWRQISMLPSVFEFSCGPWNVYGK